MGLFDNIDFNNLPADFKEDSVREEIITPLLKCLGYSTFDASVRMIRSPHLEHPFVQFGTKSHRITMIPDYLIQVDGKNAFVLDAKAPSENIMKGKHVEPVYSYAIHREIDVKLFVLCNGKELSIFHVKEKEPILHIFLNNITEQDAARLYECLSPQAFINPHIFNYKPDYGLWCIRNEIAPDVLRYFYNCHINSVMRLDDNTFTFMAVIPKEEELLATFDFDISLFEDFMNQVPEILKDKVRNSVRKSPFKYVTESEQDSFPLDFVACLSDKIIRNENEEYLPLIVKEFI